MTFEDMAKMVITLAADAGMPDSFWETDSRISAACEILKVTPRVARAWAEDNTWEDEFPED